MKSIKNTMQQRLMSADGARTQNAAQNDPEFEALVDEISVLVQQGKLPEGFDLESAAKDPELANLMREYGAEAGIRIYAAEQRAEEAENNAMERVSARVRERGALPKSTRGGSAAPAATNYHGMSSEAFRDLMQQMKKTARDGGKTRL
ncbi:MAG: hypothetical protein VB061_05295 [Christensenella sp.]|nr:hypothetical protein [Christensenella sp.]